MEPRCRPGTKIWVRSTGPSAVVLEATATATVPSGNVYLYDGNTGGVNDAQQLILAENATLRTTVQATAQFLPPGSLVVKKTIAGPAAGSQGQVVIHMVCDGEAEAGLRHPRRYARGRQVEDLRATSRPERCAPSPRHPTAAWSVRRWW